MSNFNDRQKSRLVAEVHALAKSLRPDFANGELTVAVRHGDDELKLIVNLEALHA